MHAGTHDTRSAPGADPGETLGPRPEVTAVLVTYDSADVIDAALEALEPAARAGLLECVVVDNCSSDDTRERVAARPWVRLIASPFNVGYGRGMNLGARQARGEWVLVLNADAVLTLAALENLLEFVRARPTLGVAAPALEDEHGRFHAVRPLPTPWSVVRDALPLSGGPRGVSVFEADGVARRVDWVPGAVLLVRRALYESLGGFDPRFFLYFEETDLLRRVRSSPWFEVWAVGAARALHLGGASTAESAGGKVHGDLARFFYPSRMHYLAKEHGVLAAAAAELGELSLFALRELPRRVLGRGPGKLGERLRGPLLAWPGPVVPEPLELARVADAAASPWRELGSAPRVAAVVIGRNEGARLAAALDAAALDCSPVLYVDSGSTDASLSIARERGVQVLELDATQPFSAARGRNAGWRWLVSLDDPPPLVQFIDGDCELCPGWVAAGSELLAREPRAAVVCGGLEERTPDASPYHRMAALEWDAAAGVVRACGGIFLARLDDVRLVAGFDEGLAAGEEPELCLRLRAMGREVRRLARPMAVHDLGPMGFGAWWARARRSGSAMAAGFARHGFGPERYKLRELASVAFWAVALPLAFLVLLFVRPLLALVPLGLFGFQLWRVRRARGGGLCAREAWTQAALLMLGKFAEARGALAELWRA